MALAAEGHRVDLLRVPAKVHEEKGHAMALDQSALLELLEALKLADVSDRVRTATQTLYQELIDAELTAVIGAAPHERTDTRTAQRNGSRPRTLISQVGDLELRIPKLRTGSFFPSLLERRRRIDQAPRRPAPTARLAPRPRCRRWRSGGAASTPSATARTPPADHGQQQASELQRHQD